MTIIVQRYANREIRIGRQEFQSRAGRKYDDGAVEATRERLAVAASASFCEVVRGERTSVLLDPSYGNRVLGKDEVEREEQRISSSLDIIREFQQERKDEQPKSGWGKDPKPRRFSREAKHKLLECGAVTVKLRTEGYTVLFITLTQPGSLPDSYSKIGRWSGYLCNRLFQIVRRRDRKAHYLYCWERQKRGALHLHMLLVCQSSETAWSIGRNLVDTWYKALSDIDQKDQPGCSVFSDSTGNKCTASEFWQWDIRSIEEGSAAAYLAKYLGKGGVDTEGEESEGGDESAVYPARWSGVSRKLGALAKGERIDVRIEGLTTEEEDELFGRLESALRSRRCLKQYEYSFVVKYKTEGKRPRTVGSGWRRIRYYDDSPFEVISSLIPGLLREVESLHGCNAVRYMCNSPRLQKLTPKNLPCLSS